jgi:hypothetical protein
MTSRGITVKVATQKVINALQTKLDNLDSDLATSVANEAAYKTAFEQYKKDLIDYAVANFALANNFRTSVSSYRETVNIDYDVPVNLAGFPVEPERNFEVLHESNVREAKNEITNALSILKMTDEETVNASTMKSIAKYL